MPPEKEFASITATAEKLCDLLPRECQAKGIAAGRIGFGVEGGPLPLTALDQRDEHHSDEILAVAICWQFPAVFVSQPLPI